MDAWSSDTTPAVVGMEPWISELLPDPATAVMTHSTPSGRSKSTFRRLCDVAPQSSSPPLECVASA
jgi:hypothetical protein